MMPKMCFSVIFLLVLSHLTWADSQSNHLSPAPGGTASPPSGSPQQVSQPHTPAAELFNFDIHEASRPGTFVGRINTKSGYVYRFNEPAAEFTLDPESGVIRTSNVPTDRESKDLFQLLILASTPTDPIEVKIRILDINDNAPYWPAYAARNVSFSESASIGAKVFLNTAIDRDEGSLMYQIIDSHPYRTHSRRHNRASSQSNTYYQVESDQNSLISADKVTYRTGASQQLPFKLIYNASSSVLHLEVAQYLDREQEAEYLVNISVVDSGGLQAFLPLKVFILDVNDNPPIFDASDYTVSLNESVPAGVPIMQVSASDADEEGSENARITYFLESDDYFKIDSRTGMIRTAIDESSACAMVNPSVDQDGERVCVFTVYAQDQGVPCQTGRAYVTVTFTDANNHFPAIQILSFTGFEEEISLDESIPSGSVVAAVSVLDQDLGPNGVTSLTIASGNEAGHFRLDSITNSYLIRTNRTLSMETLPQYNLTLRATDDGSPPLASVAFLLINVTESHQRAGFHAWIDGLMGSSPSVGLIVMIVFFVILIAVLSTSLFGFIWQKRIQAGTRLGSNSSVQLNTPPRKLFHHSPPPPPPTHHAVQSQNQCHMAHSHQQLSHVAQKMGSMSPPPTAPRMGLVSQQQQQSMQLNLPNQSANQLNHNNQMNNQNLQPYHPSHMMGLVNGGMMVSSSPLGLMHHHQQHVVNIHPANPAAAFINHPPPPSMAAPCSENYSEHYDLENSSSITGTGAGGAGVGSDFDLMLRYKMQCVSDPNGVGNRSKSTNHAPLTRLSPSVSETTAPRILTLQDLTLCHPQSGPIAPPLPNSRAPKMNNNHMVDDRESQEESEATDVETDDSFTSSEFGDTRPTINGHQSSSSKLAYNCAKRPW